MKIKFNLTSFILFAFYVLLATVPSLVTDDGKNYLLISFSFLGMIVLSIIHYKSFPRWNESVLVILSSYFLISYFFHRETAYVLSVVYSLFFILTFLFYSSFMRVRLTIEGYAKILKFIFILYFIGLLLGQLVVLSGSFTAVTISGGSVHGIMGVLLEQGNFRFYSLSSEPSYASFIVIALYYSFSTLEFKRDSFFKNEGPIFLFMLFYMILMFRSAYGIILLGMLAVSWFGFNKKAIALYSLVLLALVALIFSDVEIKALERVVKIAKELELNNLHHLAQIDFTSYYRLAPMLYYVETASLFDPALYFGNGAGASKLFIVPQIYLAYPDGEFAGGFMPSFLYDYGLTGFVIVVAFVYQRIKLISIPSLVVIVMLLNANLNTQLFWFVILCFTLNYHFKNITNEPVR